MVVLRGGLALLRALLLPLLRAQGEVFFLL